MKVVERGVVEKARNLAYNALLGLFEFMLA